MTLKLAVIGGDGTGPEVIGQARRVLEAVASIHGFEVQATEFPFGATHYLDTGHTLDDDDLAALRQHDAILLGAVGGQPNDPRLAGGVIEKGILLKLRFAFDQYINLRPVRLYPGVETPLAGRGPDDIDMVVVRENTEDLYCGLGGVARRGTPHEVSSQTMLATRHGVERCVRYAFDLARTRPRKHLTLVHKTNVLSYAGQTWADTFADVAGEFGDVETAYHHVDACCMYLVSDPGRYDTIVTANMFGDIITDLGAAIAGGMGVAASGNLNPRFDPADPTTGGPGMFEPVHGSSPDIAGQDKANPLAAIDSLAMLLRSTGQANGGAHADAAALQNAADRIQSAIAAVTPRFTGKKLDRSGYGTSQIGDMVLSALG